ncbi:glycoside hydrolase family 35 protein [Heterostelium album PN500]|uniref:Beta-galactosidase n=1 Tax=Heterostelium pallidum (strain ATCC 26659 / Pp 5 / PN500) TaxID=670386 RepID=D3BPY8_HETP5|nr:glycoside hydrolase family 35 protein [Heterostelium album PN500]EFA76539.1 glycoside hydrolase family 35 protein [Heterostelium album PN500]|eukprot:XP_020428671.1 glycoside hydrolase family 35 protein [Heterostelium album PN500]
MESWMRFITKYLERHFAANGGPIIMSQVENEYGWVQERYGESGTKYAQWSARLAQSLNVGVPWIMCQQDDIDSVINTCNGFYCHDWIEGHWARYPNQPAFFTENWPGWFQQWKQSTPHRPVEDVLYAVGNWFARGGSLMNYYMWHGGTNFGRTSSPMVVNSYDYDAALDEYGNPSEPKYSHAAKFNNLLQKYSHIFLNAPEIPRSEYLGGSSSIYHYTFGGESLSFLINNHESALNDIVWNGQNHIIKPWSVHLLYNNHTVFDSAATPEVSKLAMTSKRFSPVNSFNNAYISQWVEEIDMTDSTWSSKPLEQLSLTHDKTDYLWYVTEINLQVRGAEVFTTNVSDVLHAYIDGKYQSTIWSANPFNIKSDIPLGWHKLQILNSKLGVQHYTVDMEKVTGGLLGNIWVGGTDITNNGWSMKPYVNGERLAIYNPNNIFKVDWSSFSGVQQPLTWYKINFLHELSPNKHYSLNMSGMNKGMIWLNGKHVARYWITKGWGCNGCSYQGGYTDQLCSTNCGEPSQINYHLPQDWLIEGANLLVIFEEVGGNPKSIKLEEKESAYQYKNRKGDPNFQNGMPIDGESSMNDARSMYTHITLIYVYCAIIAISYYIFN